MYLIYNKFDNVQSYFIINSDLANGWYINKTLHFETVSENLNLKKNESESFFSYPNFSDIHQRYDKS